MSDSIIHVPSSDFPSDVLKWMKENAKAKMALKLMKCHKYFQHSEFPYFVVEDVEYYFDGYEQYFSAVDSEYCTSDELFKSIENITKLFWITVCISLVEVPSNLISFLIPKIAVCDITKLELVAHQLSINEFKFLAASGNIEILDFHRTTIKYENGEKVFVDQLFQFLPNLKEITISHFNTHHFSFDSINNFKEINSSKLKRIFLEITFYSDFEKLSKFMEQNPHIFYCLNFVYNSLSADETVALEKYVQKIIDNDDTEFCPPYITFLGQLKEQLNALKMLINQFYEQN